MTLRLTDTMHEWLRQEAHTRRTTITALVTAALEVKRMESQR